MSARASPRSARRLARRVGGVDLRKMSPLDQQRRQPRIPVQPRRGARQHHALLAAQRRGLVRARPPAARLCPPSKDIGGQTRRWAATRFRRIVSWREAKAGISGRENSRRSSSTRYVPASSPCAISHRHHESAEARFDSSVAPRDLVLTHMEGYGTSSSPPFCCRRGRITFRSGRGAARHGAVAAQPLDPQSGNGAWD